MKRFRIVIFWLHLVCGFLFGMFVVVMAGTGALLSFAPQIQEFAQRDNLLVKVPGNAARLPLSSVVKSASRAGQAQPRLVCVYHDAARSVVVNFGRGDIVYVDPYTGSVLPRSGESLMPFFRAVTAIHRNLGAGRIGLVVTRTATLALAVLCISGLWLWWPRSWKPRVLRTILVPKLSLSGRSRDWNWHNVVGLWSLPFVAAMTWSGLVMSIDGLRSWLYTPSATPSMTGDAASSAERPASIDAICAATCSAVPEWESLSIRMGGRGTGRRYSQDGAQIIVVVEESGWLHPLPAEVRLEASTAQVLSIRRAGDMSLREFLLRANFAIHRGDVLGLFGQAMNFAACIALVLIVWTGFALSWRRFFSKRIGRAKSREGTTS